MRLFIASMCLASIAALVPPVSASDDALSRADLSKIGKVATVYVENGHGSGSGFCVHPSGLFITNEHVVAGAGTLTVVLDSNLKTQKVVTAKVVRTDKELDLALLRADGLKDLPALSLGSVDKITETMEVMALGFPFGKLLDSQPNEYPAVSVNVGGVTSLRMKDGALHRIQVDATLNPGNSGGPVLGPDGKVVGVVVAGLQGTGVNFVIPVSHLATFLAKPEFDFQPPALTRTSFHAPVEFRARAVPLVPGAKPLSLELILTGEDGKAHSYPMEKDGDNYRVKVVPAPAPEGPGQLRASFTFSNGSVSGLVTDGAVTVGGKSWKLSELRGLHWQPAAGATPMSGKAIEGLIDAGEGFDVDLGGAVLRLKAGTMRSVIFESIGPTPSIACTVVACQGEQEVARVSQTVIVINPGGDAAFDPGALATRPTPLEQDTSVLPLPDSVDNVIVGGAGRFLIFHLPKLRQLAIFDANAGKVVKYLPLAEDNVKVAAGLDKLIVALPTSHVLQRWSLTTFEKELTAPNPASGSVAKMLMGSATRGPLVIGASGARTAPLFLDPMTLKDAGYQLAEGAGAFMNIPDEGTQARISANGEVLTSWMFGSSPMGLFTLVREGKTYKAYHQHTTVGEIYPSADGRTLFTRDGLFTAETKEIRKIDNIGGHAIWSVPALQDSYHLSFTQSSNGDKGALRFTVGIHLAGDSRPLVTLPGSKDYDGLVDWQGGRGQMFDRHVFLIPEAELLVLLPASNDKLILQRFSIDALLEKAGTDYLFVASRPLTLAVKGLTYTYSPVVKSKKGSVKLKLDSGPHGMELGSDGRLSWKVPADFAEAEATVVLTVSDASGQEVLHTFRVTVTGPENTAP